MTDTDDAESVRLLSMSSADATAADSDATAAESDAAATAGAAAEKAKKATKAKAEEEKEEEEEEEPVSIAEYAKMTVKVLVPVAATMAITVVLVRLLNFSSSGGGGGLTIGTLVYQESAGDSTGAKLLGSVLNALIFLGIILLTTVVFVALYYFRCMKVIIGWLVTSTVLLLGMIGGIFAYMLLQALNMPLDVITLVFLMWNFAVPGVVAVFWHAPRLLNRVYLITVSFLVAGYFTMLPEWTTWAILVIIAIYDVFAVLCPKGPLKVLVETAQQRQEQIPALLYNASIVMMMAEKSHGDEAEKTKPKGGATATVHPEAGAETASGEEEEEEEEKGVKLGLGDFIFYSVLVGRAALYDMLTVFTSFIAVITGLFGTLMLLGIFRRALPALPISIALGVVFYFLSRIFLIPFVVSNGVELAFI